GGVMLTAAGLDVAYGDTMVLRNVALTVPAGSVVALLGANGAGKTTLLRAVRPAAAPGRPGYVRRHRRDPLRPQRARPPRPAPHPGGPGDLPGAHGGREPGRLQRKGPGEGVGRADARRFSPSRRPPRTGRRDLERGRAADAGPGPGLRPPTPDGPARRGLHGPRPPARRRGPGLPRPPGEGGHRTAPRRAVRQQGAGHRRLRLHPQPGPPLLRRRTVGAGRRGRLRAVPRAGSRPRVITTECERRTMNTTPASSRRWLASVLGAVLAGGVLAACGNRDSTGDIARAAQANSAASTAPAASPGAGTAAPGAPAGVAGGPVPQAGSAEGIAAPAGAPNSAAGAQAGSPVRASAAAPAGSGAASGSRTAAPSAGGAPARGAAASPVPNPVPGPGGPAAGTGADCSKPKATLIIGSVGNQSGIVGAAVFPGVKAVQAWIAAQNEKGGLDC